MCASNPYAQTRLLHRYEIEHLLSNRLNNATGLDIYTLYTRLLATTPLVRRKAAMRRKHRRSEFSVSANMAPVATSRSYQISFWLMGINRDGYAAQSTDLECTEKDTAPYVKIDDKECALGCYGCAPKKKTRLFFACVKPCEWKVSYNSFCNSMNTEAEFMVDKNLYHQSNDQVYVCQGQMKCIDYGCACAPRKPPRKGLYCD